MSAAVQHLSAEQVETQQLSAAASAAFRQPIIGFSFTKQKPVVGKTQKQHKKAVKTKRRHRRRRKQ